MPKYIFLDTNIYLHYKPIEQLALERFGRDCVLVVPKVILGELNKHKDSHSSKAIRDRARSVCKRIHQWDDVKLVYSGLGFEFDMRTSSPQSHGLDPSSCDDRFLSDIIEHTALLTDKVLISNDSNLCLTAKYLGIIAEEIDEQFKLPTELDPTEQEICRLRRELDLLKNARPKLEIGLIVDESTLDVEEQPIFPLKPKEVLTDEEINRKVEEVRCSLRGKIISQSNQTVPAGFISQIYKIAEISNEDISQYHQQLSAYPEVYYKYLITQREFIRKPIYRFTIGISNVGTAPAQNVDIYLHFPDGFDVYEEDDVPSEPQKPSLPEKPKSALEKMTQQPFLGGLHNLNCSVPNIKPLSSFSMKRTNSYDISDSFRVIKHNERQCLPELFLRFDSVNDAKSFRCDYRVTVDNLPEAIKGSINFRFQAEN